MVEGVGINLLGNPTVRGLVVNARDITDRKRAEEALRQSEQRYRQIFENANDAIFILDRQARFLAVNQTLAELVGMPKEKILGATTEPGMSGRVQVILIVTGIGARAVEAAPAMEAGHLAVVHTAPQAEQNLDLPAFLRRRSFLGTQGG